MEFHQAGTLRNDHDQVQMKWARVSCDPVLLKNFGEPSSPSCGRHQACCSVVLDEVLNFVQPEHQEDYAARNHQDARASCSAYTWPQALSESRDTPYGYRTDVVGDGLVVQIDFAHLLEAPLVDAPRTPPLQTISMPASPGGESSSASSCCDAPNWDDGEQWSGEEEEWDGSFMEEA